jgi:hypothetical protein
MNPDYIFKKYILQLTEYYQNRNFFIPKIIVVFRTDLHKMKI